jgi:CheY-like chemotaxis protein
LLQFFKIKIAIMASAKDLIQYSQKLRLLYVEDDDKLREDTLRLLSTFFSQISVAKNGQEALDIYLPGEFDIVISDLVMPVMKGTDLARAIKKQQAAQMLVIMSAHDEKDVTDELQEIGVDEFIHKPLEIHAFIDKMVIICRQLAERQGA